MAATNPNKRKQKEKKVSKWKLSRINNDDQFLCDNNFYAGLALLSIV